MFCRALTITMICVAISAPALAQQNYFPPSVIDKYATPPPEHLRAPPSPAPDRFDNARRQMDRMLNVNPRPTGGRTEKGTIWGGVEGRF